MSRTLFVVVLAILCVWGLRVIPIGFHGLSETHSTSAPPNVNLLRPHYLVPREFEFSGWPFGGGFSLLGDPHFYYSPPVEFMVHGQTGKRQNAIVQVVEVNPAFKSPSLTERLLTVQVGSAIYEYNLDVENLVSDSLTSIPKFVGQIRDEIYFALRLSLPTGGIKLGLVKLDWTQTKSTANVVYEGDQLWEEYLNALNLLYGSTSIEVGQCDTRSKTLTRFFEEELGVSCS